MRKKQHKINHIFNFEGYFYDLSFAAKAEDPIFLKPMYLNLINDLRTLKAKYRSLEIENQYKYFVILSSSMPILKDKKIKIQYRNLKTKELFRESIFRKIVLKMSKHSQSYHSENIERIPCYQVLCHISHLKVISWTDTDTDQLILINWSVSIDQYQLISINRSVSIDTNRLILIKFFAVFLREGKMCTWEEKLYSPSKYFIWTRTTRYTENPEIHW